MGGVTTTVAADLDESFSPTASWRTTSDRAAFDARPVHSLLPSVVTSFYGAHKASQTSARPRLADVCRGAHAGTHLERRVGRGAGYDDRLRPAERQQGSCRRYRDGDLPTPLGVGPCAAGASAQRCAWSAGRPRRHGRRARVGRGLPVGGPRGAADVGSTARAKCSWERRPADRVLLEARARG